MASPQSPTTSNIFRSWSLLSFLFLSWGEERSLLASAFVVPSSHPTIRPIISASTVVAAAESKDDKIPEEDWDANVDYDKEWKDTKGGKDGSDSKFSNPDPATAWDDLPSSPDLPVLGIDISLDPISKEDAEAIKSEAKEVIEEQFQRGIDDIEKMRVKMNRELQASRKAMQLASELNARSQSEQLMNKIDKMTNNFLSSSEESRRTTKLAAAASQAMEGTGQGIEMGTWGTLGDRTVVADDSSIASSVLLGSVDNAVSQQGQQGTASEDDNDSDQQSTKSRIIVVADTKQDSIAKQVVPALLEQFDKTNIQGLEVDVLTPTSTMPLGGNDAECVVVFTTSLSQASSLSNILDRLLRKTLQGGSGKIGQPPTQLVAISTVGTERFDKFPYSFQNMMGGKLESRRQIEEVIINQVKKRVAEPPLDYTIVKLGELKGNANNFELHPGDSLDDPTDVSTAAETIIQAVAYQPYARNSTLSISGSTASSGTVSDDDEEEMRQLFWDKTFLCLDGPEIWRDDNVGDVSMYDSLVEYLQGWGELLAETRKGLTTPVTTEILGVSSSRLVAKQEGIELLFLPTKTGRNYVSKTEEREQESQSGGRSSKNMSTKVFNRKTTKEGGIDVVVEITREDPPQLRVRARRCNYGDDAIIKELSEETILKRLKDAIEVWETEHLKK